MKRAVLFKAISMFFCAGVSLQQLPAQVASIRYHELATVSFRNPIVISKISHGFAITDMPTIEGTPVYFIDSSLQLTRKLFVPIAAYEANGYTKGNSLRFIWQERLADSVKIRQVQASDDGAITNIEKKFMAPGASRVYKQMVSDKQNQYFFFHTWFISAEQLVLKGVLLDSLLTPVQEIDSRFKYDSSLQRQTQVLLDVKGNLHIALYDKLTNYRMSADIHLQTITYGTNYAVNETFQFTKAKFYDLIFFDNPVKEEIQLAGFYYDGSTKIKTGLASIRFPYERKKPAHENFILFTKAQRIDLLKGMEHVRRKNDVMDFIKLRDIIEEDGQVFLSAWILDIPNYLIVKDNEKERMRNTEVVDWIRSDKEGNTTNIRRFTNASQRPGRMASDLMPNEVTNTNTFDLRPSANTMLRSLPITQNNSGMRPGRAALPTNPNISINWISPKKFAFFSLNTDHSMWMQLLPANFPIASASYQPAIWDYPLVENDQLYFIHLQQPEIKGTPNGPQTGTGIPVASMVNITANSTTVTPDTTLNLSQLRLGRPLKLKTGKYLLPYRRLEKNQNGLAVFEIKP